MYATQTKVKWSVLQQILDIDEKYLDQDAQVIVLFENKDKYILDSVMECSTTEEEAYERALNEQKNNQTYSLKDLQSSMKDNA